MLQLEARSTPARETPPVPVPHPLEPRPRVREDALEAVAFAAERLLAPGSWRTNIGQALARLGAATGSNHAGLARVTPHEGGAPTVEVLYEWTRFDWGALIESVQGVRAPQTWATSLRGGEALLEATDALEKPLRSLLQAAGVRSSVWVPLAVGDETWGALALGDERNVEEWPIETLEALTIVAKILGAAIAREEIELELERNERDFRRLGENWPDQILRLTPDMTIVYANPAAEQVIGLPAGTLVGSKIGELPLDDRLKDHWIRHLTDAIEKDAPVVTEVAIASRDGEAIQEARAIPERDPSGGLESILVFSRDVTARRRSERALRERMKELDCLYSISRDLQNGHDPDELLDSVVRRIREATLDPEDVWVRVEIDGETHVSDPAIEPPDGAIHAEIAFRGETHGLVSAFSLGGTPFLPEEQSMLDAIAEMLGMWLERIGSLEGLRGSERRFRLLAEHARDVVFRYRLGSDPGFEYVSPSIQAMTGYTPEAMYADPMLVMKLVHPEDRAVLDLSNASEDSVSELVRLRWVRRDGRVIWTEHQNVLDLDEAGRPVALEAIVRDITSRENVEERLQVALEQLEARVAVPIPR